MNRRQGGDLQETDKTRSFEAAGLARVHYAAAVLKDEASQIWKCLGQEAMLQGDIEEALWYFRRSVEVDGQTPVVWQLLGRCFEEIGDEPRARDCYRLATRLLTRGAPVTQWSEQSLSLLWDFPEPHEA